MPLPDMEAGALRRALNEAFDTGVLFDDDLLAKNQVGNLSIIRGDEFVGIIDLRTADVEIFTEED